MQTTTATTIEGVYALDGIRESAGAFKFDSSGKFEFFFSYGAVDRTAFGTFRVEGNKIILKSNKEPGKDFTVTKQSTNNDGFIVVAKAPNSILASYVKAVVVNGQEKEPFNSDNHGVIKINSTKAEKIYLQHELYPDILTLIKDENNKNNHFEVSLNQIMEQVSFKGIDLTIEGDTLTMPTNYFMPFRDIRFVKGL